MNNKWHKNKCSKRECQSCHPPSVVWMGFLLGEALGRLEAGPGAGSRWFALPRAMRNGQGAAPRAGPSYSRWAAVRSAQGYFSCYVWKRAVTLVCYMRPCRTLFGKKPFLRLKKAIKNVSHCNRIQSAPAWPFICKDFTTKSSFFFFLMKNSTTNYLRLIGVTLLLCSFEITRKKHPKHLKALNPNYSPCKGTSKLAVPALWCSTGPWAVNAPQCSLQHKSISKPRSQNGQGALVPCAGRKSRTRAGRCIPLLLSNPG